MAAQQFAINLTLEAKDEKEKQDIEKAVKLLVKNLDRDSLTILAIKSQKEGINQRLKQYQNFI